jgi:hypothetical protein
MERRIHPSLARFGLTKYWNLYVLRVPGTLVPPADGLRGREEIESLERRWKLDERVADPADVESVRQALDLPADVALW